MKYFQSNGVVDMRLKFSIALLLMLIAARAPALETDLKYIAFTGDGAYVSASSGVEFKNKAPVGKVLPQAIGTPLYGTLRLGNTERLVMLDRREANDKRYSRIRVDINADGDLTNDKPIDARTEALSDSFARMTTTNIELTNKPGDKSSPYCVQLMIQTVASNPSLFKLGRAPAEQTYCIVQSRCCYLADFQLDGKQYQISFSDYNVNGQFHDPPATSMAIGAGADSYYYADGDRIYIKNGGSFDRNSEQPFPKWIVLGSKLFEMKADFDAGKLTLTPIEAAGTIGLPASLINLSMLRTDTRQAMAVYKPAGQVKMPAGPWKMVSYQLERTDPQGDRWRLQARGNFALQPYQIENTTSTTLPIGEPFTPVISFPQSSSKQASLAFSIKDRGQARVTALSHEGNKTRIALSKLDPSLPKEPSWTAVTTKGEKVASGSFEYG